MQSLTVDPSLSWLRRAVAFVARLVRPLTPDTRRFVAWADMQPIDFDGEDDSLTERDLQRMK